MVGDDVERSSVVGDDVERSSVVGDDVEHSSVVGDDVERSSVVGDDVEHSSVVGDDVELSSVVGDDVEHSSVVGDDVEYSMVDSDKGSRGSGSRGGRGNSRGRGSRGGRGSSRGRGSRGGRGSSRGCGSRGGRGSSRGSGSRGGRGSRLRGGRGSSIHGRQAELVGKRISIEDSDHIEPDDFYPLRVPGPHLPEHVDEDASELDLFQLFIDEHTLERLVTSTNDYAEKNRCKKSNMYKRFRRHRLTPEEMMRYLGCLLLLSINSVRNYRLAWSKKSSQHLSHLHRLLTRDRFEAIGAFLHIVTKEEEASLSSHKLKKILPLHDIIKKKCLELYQPLQQLSVDERMVKSKARTQFRQYIRNKPTKWGYKYWVLADPTGYTVDFDIYCGTDQQSSGKGLGYDVVTTLTLPFQFQGYQVFCDNFYSSPALFCDLLEKGITATGTARTNRVGIPQEVQCLKEALDKNHVQRGTGFYFRPKDSRTAYVVWKDSKCVTVMTTAYPGHSISTVKRRVKNTSTGLSQTQDVPIPVAIEKYNSYMGGVDKSDQYISYNQILRKTVRYWKTFLYHLLEIVATNSSILYN